MRKIAKDVAERIYSFYSATMMSPVKFDELFSVGENGRMEVDDKILHAYERGIVITNQQVAGMHNLHRRNMNEYEPYDVGVLNTLSMMLFILGVKPINIEDKPPGLADLEVEFKARAKEFVEVANLEREHYQERIATMKESRKAVEKYHKAELEKQSEKFKTNLDKLSKRIEELEDSMKKLKTPKKEEKPDTIVSLDK